MPLSIAAWECLGTMKPKHPNHVGPIEKRLGSEESLEVLIHSGHLKRTGAMVVRTAASVDAFRVFDCLPDDGSARGNATLTANGEGHRRGTGAWTRPDVVAISVTEWELVPGVVAEIHSYELKPYPVSSG